MVAVPVKPEYGPTLGRLLAPRWHAACALARALVIGASLATALALVAAFLTLENAHYSHGGAIPFSFSYRGLHRVVPLPGQFVRIEQRRGDGALEYSYAVGSLYLPAYEGELSGELPVYASRLTEVLAHQFADFMPRGDGKTKVNTVFAYDVLFLATVEGRRMYGRDVLLLPERAHARRGVVISMLTAPWASRQVKSPIEVGTVGVLQRPLRSFTLG